MRPNDHVCHRTVSLISEDTFWWLSATASQRTQTQRSDHLGCMLCPVPKAFSTLIFLFLLHAPPTTTDKSLFQIKVYCSFIARASCASARSSLRFISRSFSASSLNFWTRSFSSMTSHRVSSFEKPSSLAKRKILSKSISIPRKSMTDRKLDAGRITNCHEFLGSGNGENSFELSEFLLLNMLLYRRCRFSLGREIQQIVVPKGI